MSLEHRWIDKAARAWVHPPKALPDPQAWRAGWLARGNPDAITGAVEMQLMSHPAVPWGEYVGVVALAESMRRAETTQEMDDEADAQIARAARYLDYTPDDFVRWPFPSLDELVGGMAPGTLHFIASPSKGGKTTLCRSGVRAWLAQGRRVLYAGFELKAETLRTMFAAEDCGLDPGDVLSGAWLGFDRYLELRQRMEAAYHAQRGPESPYNGLRFTGFDTVDLRAVHGMMESAQAWGADVVVVDHIDHVQGDDKTRGLYETSVKVTHAFLELAKRLNLRVVVTTQLNRDGKGRDRWLDHRPIREERIKYGAHKLEVATTVLGWYRPLRPGVTREERDAVEHGEAKLSTVLADGMSAANVIASRNYGSKIGDTALLGWERGRIVELSPADKHGLSLTPTERSSPPPKVRRDIA